jgi:hypothetical protein
MRLDSRFGHANASNNATRSRPRCHPERDGRQPDEGRQQAMNGEETNRREVELSGSASVRHRPGPRESTDGAATLTMDPPVLPARSSRNQAGKAPPFWMIDAKFITVLT